MTVSTRRLEKAVAAAAVAAAILLPTAAGAYVGPGAGLSLLGALWALVVALGLAVAFVVAWPVRRMLRRRQQRAQVTRKGDRPLEADDDAREAAGAARSSNA